MNLDAFPGGSFEWVCENNESEWQTLKIQTESAIN